MTVQSVSAGCECLNALLAWLDQVAKTSDYIKCSAVNRPDPSNVSIGEKENEMPFASEPGRRQIKNSSSFAFETSRTIGASSK